LLLVGAGSAVAYSSHSRPRPAAGPASARADTRFDRRVLAENWLTSGDDPQTYFWPNWVAAGYDATW
jgi:hypothetical protein